MTKNETNVTNVDDVKCYLVKTDDGVAIRFDDGHTEPCPVSNDGLAYKLPANPANRTWFTLKKFATLVEQYPDGIPLTYRASRTLTPVADRIPNQKLVEQFLNEEELAEYKAIIEKAKARMAEAKATKPVLTEEEKLVAQIERAKARLAKLQGGNE